MYSDGDIAEVWFKESCRKLGLLDVLPSLQLVKRVLNKQLSAKVKTALLYMENENDVGEWLDLVLKTDCLLLIENVAGEMLRVAVDVTADLQKSSSKLAEIDSVRFRAARRELGIARHWIVVVRALEISSRATLIDTLYNQIDIDIECAIVELE